MAKAEKVLKPLITITIFLLLALVIVLSFALLFEFLGVDFSKTLCRAVRFKDALSSYGAIVAPLLGGGIIVVIYQYSHNKDRKEKEQISNNDDFIKVLSGRKKEEYEKYRHLSAQSTTYIFNSSTTRENGGTDSSAPLGDSIIKSPAVREIDNLREEIVYKLKSYKFKPDNRNPKYFHLPYTPQTNSLHVRISDDGDTVILETHLVSQEGEIQTFKYKQ